MTPEPTFRRVADRYPFALTPYYASLFDRSDPQDPLALMVMPDERELEDSPDLGVDPLEEEAHSPLPRVIRRYRSRILLVATGQCACYCRFCLRKRISDKVGPVSEKQLQDVVSYLSSRPEINEVLVSGGDPLTLSDHKLDSVLAALKSPGNVEILRIGSRMPAVQPSRITPDLVNIVSAYKPVFVLTHFNHPRELTAEAQAACAMFIESGIVCLNQSVLLAGVNDDAWTLASLFNGLLKWRVKPYYLFQCDLVEGVNHFRTPLKKGFQIMRDLSVRLGGLALPKFVVDLPGGKDKVPVNDSHVSFEKNGRVRIMGFDGSTYDYPDIG